MPSADGGAGGAGGAATGGSGGQGQGGEGGQGGQGGQGGAGGGSTDGGVDGGVADTGEQLHTAAPLNLMFDSQVNVSLHVGDAWFVGGDFSRAEVKLAHNALGVTVSGNVSGCDARQGFDGDVKAVAHLGNAVYFGGAFTHYRGALANRIAKVDATTCALDTTFSPPTANGFNDEVLALAPTADGALIVGGNFRVYRDLEQTASPWYLTKLDATTGAIVDAFHNTVGKLVVDAQVNTVVVDGTTLWVGGSFTRCAGVDHSCTNIAKLNLTTAVADTTFSPVGTMAQPYRNGFNSIVLALAVTPTHVFAGGYFDAYRQGAPGNSPYNANHIAKLDKTTGALVPVFGAAGQNVNGFNYNVNALVVDGNTLYAAGDFQAYKGVADSARNLAKLDHTTGAIDTTFSPPGAMANGFDAIATSLALSGNSLFVGGAFEWYRGVPYVAPGIAKLDKTTGVLDTTFHPTGDTAVGVVEDASERGVIYAMDLSGSTLWLGGHFSYYGGKSANALAKFLDATGAFDTTFSPPGVTGNGFDNSVYALASDGTSLFVGGSFNRYKRVLHSAHGIAKLSLRDGALDPTFNPVGPTANGFDGDVYSLVVDGTTLWVAGSMSAYRGVDNSANAVAKLSLTGVLDTTFSPPGMTTNGFYDQSAYALAVTPTALYVGGSFTNYRALGPNTSNRLAKLDKVTGVLDATFSPPGAMANGTDAEVKTLAVADNALFVGGSFTQYRGASYRRLVKVDLATGAPMMAFGGAPGTTHGFDADVNVLMPLGTSLFVGGSFSTYQAVPASASYMTKLNLSDGALNRVFTPTGAPRPNDFTMLTISSYGEKVLLGGYLAYCDNSTCVSHAIRVNATTRQPE